MALPMSAYGTWPPELQNDDIVKPAKSQWKARLSNLANLFVLGGSLLLCLMAIAPIWNAVSLLQDMNYVFWVGRNTPTLMIILCVFVVVIYLITSTLFFHSLGVSEHTDENIMMLANIFITLFGVFLLSISMPLTWQAELTSSNIMTQCATSEQTHRLYEFSLVLQNIRATPACAKKFSVEECAGYEAAPPYTDYLKDMENSFLCAGFCYSAPSSKTKAAKLLDIGAASELHASATYPPTLFSDSNFKASCDGMAARNMQNMAGDIGQQTFYQGIYLVLVAVATGFLKLLGFCVRRKE